MAKASYIPASYPAMSPFCWSAMALSICAE